MNNNFSIRPSKDIRNHYAQISELCKKNPVAITVNGKEDTVLLSHESYMEQQLYVSELEAKLAMYAHLAEAADDIKLGRIQPMEKAFDDVAKALEQMDL